MRETEYGHEDNASARSWGCVIGAYICNLLASELSKLTPALRCEGVFGAHLAAELLLLLLLVWLGLLLMVMMG